MKTYVDQPLKQGRTFDAEERRKQHPPLQMLLRTYRSSAGNFPVQLAKKEYKVFGITHIVQMNEKGSLMDGKTICRVNSSDKVWINDSVQLQSRRGPNREVYEPMDRRGKPLYKWYSVEKLNGEALPPDCFIREDTLVAEDREIERSVEKRTRISSGQVPEYECAARIVQSAKSLVLPLLDESGLSGRESVSLFTIKLAYALSGDTGIRRKLTDGRAEEVMEVIRILEQVCGKQLLQDWSSNKESDLEMRKYAWLILQEVVTGSIEAEQKREILRDCLDHDKGYAQILTYLQDGLLPSKEVSLSFEEIVEEALKEERNMNIFGGSMVNGTILEQMKKEETLHTQPTKLDPEREREMWVSITTAIVNVKSRGQTEKDWLYYTTMEKEIDTLFERVRSKTPKLLFDKDLLREFLAEPY